MNKAVNLEEAERQLQTVKQSIKDSAKPEKVPLKALFKPALRLVLTIGIVVAVLQQITGINSVFFYAPMIFEQSVQACFLIPMAISLGYGILFTTVVILLLMPVLWVIYHDVRNWWISLDR